MIKELVFYNAKKNQLTIVKWAYTHSWVFLAPEDQGVVLNDEWEFIDEL